MRHREFTCSLFFLVTALNSLISAALISSNMLVAYSILPAKETEPLIESWNCATPVFFAKIFSRCCTVVKSKFWKLFFPPLLKLIHSQQKHCSCLRHSLPCRLFYEEKKKQEAALSIIPHSPLPAPTSSVELNLRGIVKSLFQPFETWIQFSLPLYVLPGLLGLLQHQLKKERKK